MDPVAAAPQSSARVQATMPARREEEEEEEEEEGERSRE
jgi:ribosomal protein L12E/L44/L45/RPP1/RPP2